VATIYPGASPSEVENTVTKKKEDAVASLENIKK
jgi:HAE1 family hydrophobic/amphiphilic exporter-1